MSDCNGLSEKTENSTVAGERVHDAGKEGAQQVHAVCQQDSKVCDSQTVADNSKIGQFAALPKHKDMGIDSTTMKPSTIAVKVNQKDPGMWKMVPPDGGWGWLVLAGSMLVNILVPGTVKSFGVLFVEFLEVFDASPAAAAWIPALCYFLYCSLGPLSSILSVKYSYRTVTILGGAFAAAGMILSFWASSVTYLYFSYGVLVGTGAGLSFPPTVYIVTSYFVRLRGLANGLCTSGSAIGSIILPPVLRYLLETYGYRGAVLIMGGVTLNVWVAAIFYQPVEQHMKRVLKTCADIADEDVLAPVVNDKKAVFTLPSDDTPFLPPKEDNKSPEMHIKYSDSHNTFVRSASAAAVQNYNNNTNADDRQRKVSAPACYTDTLLIKNNLINNNQVGSITHPLHAVKESVPLITDYSLQSRLPSFSQKSVKITRQRSPSTSSFQYVCTPYHGSTLSVIKPTDFTSHLSLRSIKNTLNPATGCCGKKEKKPCEEKERNKYFDISLLKDPTYLVILISNSTNAISYTNFIILVPSYAIMLGFNKGLAAWLLSVVSAFDLVGRIGGSTLSDLGFIPKQWYFIGGLAISGVSLAMLPLAESYLMVCFFCGLFGLASGVYVGITPVIMADMLGVDRLTSTFGISLFVNGILQLIGPPLCGWWFEEVGTYVPLFTTLGFVLIGGAAIWGFIPLINRRKLINQMTDAEKNALSF